MGVALVSRSVKPPHCLGIVLMNPLAILVQISENFQHMNKILLLLLMAVLGIASAQAGDMRRLSVNGIERTYYLHVPTGLRSGAPLVIMLHGRDDDGKTDVDRYGWERVANGNRFVVAGPDAPTLHAGRAPSRENYTMWNSEPGTPGDIAKSDDTAFIAAMI